MPIASMFYDGKPISFVCGDTHEVAFHQTNVRGTPLRSCRNLARIGLRPNSDEIGVWSTMERSLAVPIRELAFSDHKMAMVSGPRQCGKTTLGKMLLDERKAGAYHNWDDVTFRRAWTKAPQTMMAGLTTSSSVPLIVLDEIHKARGWKRTLKGVYDTHEKAFDLIVTGIARLNVYKKGGDSLMGRGLHFHLHPLSVAE